MPPVGGRLVPVLGSWRPAPLCSPPIPCSAVCQHLRHFPASPGSGPSRRCAIFAGNWPRRPWRALTSGS